MSLHFIYEISSSSFIEHFFAVLQPRFQKNLLFYQAPHLYSFFLRFRAYFVGVGAKFLEIFSSDLSKSHMVV